MASGTNTTVRQVGAALGVAVIGSVFASLTVSAHDRRGAGDHAPGGAARHRGRRRARAGRRRSRSRAARPAVDAATLSHALATGHHRRGPAGAAARRRVRRVGAFLSLLLPRPRRCRAHDRGRGSTGGRGRPLGRRARTRLTVRRVRGPVPPGSRWRRARGSGAAPGSAPCSAPPRRRPRRARARPGRAFERQPPAAVDLPDRGPAGPFDVAHLLRTVAGDHPHDARRRRPR